MKRFKQKLYYVEKLAFINHHLRYVKSDDGTLFSGNHRTKILPSELPEWYVYGRYYKCFGYLSTLGITDLLYIPNEFSNHYLKDDYLYISYGGKIEENPAPKYCWSDKYIGYDHYVYGSEIISVLKGARQFSGFDITDYISKLKDKKEWLRKTYPEEFGTNRWKFDVDACFEEPLTNAYPDKYYKSRLETANVLSSESYYGTTTNFDKGPSNHSTLSPVVFIADDYRYQTQIEWELTDSGGQLYRIFADRALIYAIVVLDDGVYHLCVKPSFIHFKVINCESGEEIKPESVSFGPTWQLCSAHTQELSCHLYITIKEFSSAKDAVCTMRSYSYGPQN